jgi:flagellar protein FlaG
MNTVNPIQGANPALAAAVASVAPERTAEQREVIQAIKAVNAAELFGENSELTFVLDRESRRPVVRIVDRQTNEVIQQIPPEYVLRMAQELKTAQAIG